MDVRTTNHVSPCYRNCGFTIATTAGHPIATPATPNERRALADQLYDLVLSYRQAQTA